MRCYENKCCLGLRGLSDYTILKGELVLPDKKVCDCIIFHDDIVPHVVLVELKRGLVRPGHVQEKFKNTLEWLLKTEEQFHDHTDYRVVLLLLYGRGISKSDHSVLRAHSFKLKGKKYSLQVLPCSTQLADLYARMTIRGHDHRRGSA